MTDALAQPYPERIAELERELHEAYRLIAEVRGHNDKIADSGEVFARRILELERKLEITRQQYMDADHGLRLRDTECRRLRSEASELMAENSDKALHIADLRQRLDWHTTNAERQASVIREQGAEIERLRKPPLWKVDATGNAELVIETPTGQHDLTKQRFADSRTWPCGIEPTSLELSAEQTLREAHGRHWSYFPQAERRRLIDLECRRLRDEERQARHAPRPQHDLPPTRAETDAMASLANTLAGIDNEERD